MGRAVERVLDVFVAFSSERRPLSISELARLLDIPTSTCHGLVKDLEGAGYLVEVKRGQGYYPTNRLPSVVSNISLFDPVAEILMPELHQIKDAIDETVFVAKRARQQVNYLISLETQHSLRFMMHVGASQPIHATALGKALLGAMEVSSRNQLINGLSLERHTAKTITSKKRLAAEIEEQAKRGWFASIGEHMEDVVGVAIAVSYAGEKYAVGIGGPIVRVQNKLNIVVPTLKKFKAAFEAKSS
jgi:IclR family acetate operon transcriptional repressor